MHHLGLCGKRLSLLPTFVEAKERSRSLDPLDESRTGSERSDGVMSGSVQGTAPTK
jgi:hypothetical protein